jgi:hypothetical protein
MDGRARASRCRRRRRETGGPPLPSTGRSTSCPALWLENPKTTRCFTTCSPAFLAIRIRMGKPARPAFAWCTDTLASRLRVGEQVRNRSVRCIWVCRRSSALSHSDAATAIAPRRTRYGSKVHRRAGSSRSPFRRQATSANQALTVMVARPARDCARNACGVDLCHRLKALLKAAASE